MTADPGRWWYLDLWEASPDTEMYYGGWKFAQELDLVELGQRVMDYETDWLPAHYYSRQRDRVWAAVSYMYRAVIEKLRGITGRTEIDHSEVPLSWRPDLGRWDGDRHYMEEEDK